MSDRNAKNHRPYAMKIDWLITELNTLGGAENYVRQMAPRLQQAGHAIRIITLISGGQLVTELRDAGIPVIELGLQTKVDWQALKRLRQVWRREKPDLVHTHLYHAGVIGRIAARALGIRPVVVHQHGAERARTYPRTLIDRITSPLVAQYVATCEAVAKILQQRERISATKITVIYNGIESRSSVGSIHSVNPHSPVTLISVGRLSPEKGHKFLLEALVHLKSKHGPIQLHLVGDGELSASLAGQVNQANLSGCVQLLGSRRDVPDLLASADIFVLPSEWEGMSMALLEAMTARLPVVATSVGGTTEVVIDGITGFLVPPRNPAALANALSLLIQDPDLRLRMGEAGYRRASEIFNIANTVQQTQELYERLTHL